MYGGGGGGKIFPQKIVYRKIFSDKIPLCADFRKKRGRWVYEGSGLDKWYAKNGCALFNATSIRLIPQALTSPARVSDHPPLSKILYN